MFTYVRAAVDNIFQCIQVFECDYKPITVCFVNLPKKTCLFVACFVAACCCDANIGNERWRCFGFRRSAGQTSCLMLELNWHLSSKGLELNTYEFERRTVRLTLSHHTLPYSTTIVLVPCSLPYCRWHCMVWWCERQICPLCRHFGRWTTTKQQKKLSISIRPTPQYWYFRRHPTSS